MLGVGVAAFSRTLSRRVRALGAPVRQVILAPDILRRWYRTLVAAKYDGSQRRGSVRPRRPVTLGELLTGDCAVLGRVAEQAEPCIRLSPMLVHSYGLFWRAEEINWNPGKGNRQAFTLLGREGKNKGTLRLADFRPQQGIYILYGNTGPHYVGLTRRQGFGKRLKDHLTDQHRGRWDRFSWFGFRSVNGGRDKKTHLQTLRAMPAGKFVDPNDLIKDVEALLIQAMSLKNAAQMNFKKATRWDQVKLNEVEHYMDKLR